MWTKQQIEQALHQEKTDLYLQKMEGTWYRVHLFCILNQLTLSLGTLSLCRQVGPEPIPGPNIQRPANTLSDITPLFLFHFFEISLFYWTHLLDPLVWEWQSDVPKGGDMQSLPSQRLREKEQGKVAPASSDSRLSWSCAWGQRTPGDSGSHVLHWALPVLSFQSFWILLKPYFWMAWTLAAELSRWCEQKRHEMEWN